LSVGEVRVEALRPLCVLHVWNGAKGPDNAHLRDVEMRDSQNKALRIIYIEFLVRQRQSTGLDGETASESGHSYVWRDRRGDVICVGEVKFL
jgi:hypothetical protein